MQIEFIGGARTVTGSLHVVSTGETRVLLDCGLFEGSRREAHERNLNQAASAAGADALVLSHAHMDHSGNIPTLIRAGFDGSIWSTPATRDLCVAMLRDSAHIQEEDANYLNRRRERRGEPPVQPLYTLRDAADSMRSFVSVNYDRGFEVAPGVRMTFSDAGHILGSSLTTLELRENGRTARLGYTADLGAKGQPILRDPDLMVGLNYLVMESTYGARSRENGGRAREMLRRIVIETYRRGGKVIIPAFAVGRTQELIYDLYMLSKDRSVPRLPIFVDSPLAVDITEVFRLHPECYDEEMLAELEKSRFGPLGYSQVHYVRAVEESKDLNFLRDPAIIVSASGMVEAGRILHHLKNNVGDERNTVLFVGYQAQNTLGRRILEGAKKIRIFDEELDVRARVESIEAYSAHADRDQLIDYAEAVAAAGDLQGVFLVHGEDEATMALAHALSDRGLPNVRVPKPGEVVGL
ncbi:MAG: MBL fold metallo-hydrolase RNA specificity domain-containing protein [Anaerolineae bacterium]